MIDGKTILITGGTGSFGKTVVNKLLMSYKPKEIIIYSRDEKKQFDMRNKFTNLCLRFVIGDVRDREKVYKTMRGIDFVFHAAALKQVPTCEFFPMEAIKTNIMGTHNVLDAAEDIGVEKVVVLSTDKAVYPINAMGMTKALIEKLMLAKARSTTSKTIFCGVRYGNVMYSRGSVLPLFVELLKNGKPLTVTNSNMTRFLLPLPIAIDLVLFALKNAQNGDILKLVRLFPDPPLTSFRLNNIISGVKYDLHKTKDIVGDLPFNLNSGVEGTLDWMNIERK